MARILAAAPGALQAVVRAILLQEWRRGARRKTRRRTAVPCERVENPVCGAEWCALVTDAFNPTTARASPERPANLPDHCAAFRIA